jgi:hypothetical protein
MKIIKTPMQVVDSATGEVIEEKTATWMLSSPLPDKCQTCAVDHAPDEPHNAQSLYYQYAFYADHGRWPTWADAIAHCSPEIQALWKEELQRRNAWSEPEASP